MNNLAWRIAPPWSKNLRKYGQAQATVQMIMLAVGCGFYGFAVTSDDPVMPATTYGTWVTSYPAEYWALSIMAACVFYLLGVFINGAWRIGSPVMRVIGSAWHVITLAAFAWGSYGTADGDPILIVFGCTCLANCVFLGLNMGDTLRAFTEKEAESGPE